MNRQLARACVVTCVVAVVGSLVTAAADSAAPSRTPAVVGVVPAGSLWKLAPLDPRTLRPVRGSWSHRVTDTNTALVRSPRGTAVVASGRRTIFVDTRTGRELRRSTPGAISPVLYWVGESASSAAAGPRCTPSSRTAARAMSGTCTSTSHGVRLMAPRLTRTYRRSLPTR